MGNQSSAEVDHFAQAFYEGLKASDGFSREADNCAGQNMNAAGIILGLLIAAMNVMAINAKGSREENKKLFLDLAAAAYEEHQRLTAPKN